MRSRVRIPPGPLKWNHPELNPIHGEQQIYKLPKDCLDTGRDDFF
jgi:hypothetical protein